MVYREHIKGGIDVLDPDVKHPEGTEARKGTFS